uniref:Ras association domain family member 3 n=1 Tax=Felis catus TaxID=9685 RepID=A0ABI7XXD5_FELCA
MPFPVLAIAVQAITSYHALLELFRRETVIEFFSGKRVYYHPIHSVDSPSRGRDRMGCQWDVEKEKETHNYLSKEEIKEKVHKYNLAVTDKLKMTLNSNGIYTGFIKVQMELCRPPQTSPSLGKIAPSSNGCTNTLHISSTNTVGEVIEALLKKFLVTESPAKFALYKRCHREDQVYACKLSDREHPLYLRLVAGPRTDTLSFVLREHEIGEWEAFSLPELQNFLRILDKEEDEQLQSLKRRYAAYRHKLEEALSEVWKPD